LKKNQVNQQSDALSVRDLERFSDNLRRLLGLHGITQHKAAQLLEVTAATMSTWMTGKAVPSLGRATRIARLFEIPTDRLLEADFSDLLAHELSDPDRFRAVEARLK
jgi:transcriptional regulator with XRE-family HTH domain